MKRVTLRQLMEMFQKLPAEVLDKEIAFLDLAHMEEEDLKNLERRLRDTVFETQIAICEN